MRILFATTDGAGHFGPLVPFAHACLRAGHDVLVVGQAGAASLAERARALLDDPRFRDRAQRIADEMRALPPIDDAVDALSALVSGQRAA